MTFLRSLVFFLWFVGISVVLMVGLLPLLFFSRLVVIWAPKTWCRWNLWGLKVITGLGYEVRGTIPNDAVLVASKHMSMWETLALYHLLEDPIVVLKDTLLNVPLYGWYARRSKMIFVNRDGHASALRKMAADARAALAGRHPILIFPEGTRKKPEAPTDYRPGVAALYSQIDVPCVPVALNSGLFWTGPMGFLKKRGTIVIEFLKPIPPGLRSRDFMSTLKDVIETATAKLVTEGRGQLAGR
ncbi:MAG: 1-acyl-sn-glycerol-3-phosphate acyltransferase [Proteobacteria bacterium]|nr:1-acyl-sn-glycerol-3-phosphate acyltransferase [Pseudomonadota bacterium]